MSICDNFSITEQENSASKKCKQYTASNFSTFSLIGQAVLDNLKLWSAIPTKCPIALLPFPPPPLTTFLPSSVHVSPRINGWMQCPNVTLGCWKWVYWKDWSRKSWLKKFQSMVYVWHYMSHVFQCNPQQLIPARQNGNFRWNFAYFLPTFRRWYPIHHFSAHMFTDSAHFCSFSTYFLPKMVHPCYKLKHGTPSDIFLPTCFHRIPPFFHLCSVHFLPNLPLIFHLSHLAGMCVYTTWQAKALIRHIAAYILLLTKSFNWI